MSHEGLRRVKGRLGHLTRSGDVPELDRLLARVPDGVPVYSSFLRWARTEFGATGWYEAPYDWRLRPADNLAAVDRVVERARRETKSDRVILLGHSQGGLVAREYLASAGKDKVRALVAVGTPWLGAPQAARAVFLGHDLGLGVTLPDRLPELGRVPEVRARVNDPAFGPRTVSLPLRLSLARAEDTRALAATFPSMFLMMPGPEHAAHLAALLHPAGEVSVVAEWSPREYGRRVVEANRPAAEWAARWRRAYLNGDSHGVDHILLGYASDPRTPRADQQVVRFSVQGERHRGKYLDDQAVRLLRRLADRSAKRAGSSLDLDGFIPTDLGPDLGDGTVPLFSATGGAVIRAGQKPNREAAAGLLGPRAEVVAGTLSPGKDHMRMLDDPRVREEIAASCGSRVGPR